MIETKSIKDRLFDLENTVKNEIKSIKRELSYKEPDYIYDKIHKLVSSIERAGLCVSSIKISSDVLRVLERDAYARAGVSISRTYGNFICGYPVVEDKTCYQWIGAEVTVND